MVVAHKIRRPKEDSSIWSEFRKFVVLALRSLVHPLQPKSVEAQVHQGSSRSVSGCSVKSHGHLEPHHISYDIRFFALSRRASFHDIISPIELRVFYQGSGPASDFQDSAPPVCEYRTSRFIPHNTARSHRPLTHRTSKLESSVSTSSLQQMRQHLTSTLPINPIPTTVLKPNIIEFGS
ncbi:hypothetical protein DL98DRAFT_144355 [Cadophora sp. DSE1049]|nr:hypothetical protein DL98DRAFT_144355 [Cadophora sp. DSE1049]